MPLVIPPEAWKPVTTDVFSTPGHRNPVALLAAVNQFDVEHHERYKVKTNPLASRSTYCNIFLWDVTKALGCEIPHWVDPATGETAKVGHGIELTANKVCDWLALYGQKHGWVLCNEISARNHASGGCPTVVVWKNNGGIGHVAVVLPGMDYTHIAQAGKTNFFDRPAANGFGANRPLVFYTHE